jgi:2-hydroxy-6-oxonona-2,4-dienedioate hydrolase
MNKGDGSMIGSGRSALAARRDMVGGTRIFSRYSLAPVHSRQPVVLIHGMVIASGFYRRALKRIGNHHRAFAPDLPGYGRSDKPENLPRIDDQADVLAAWMDRLGLKDAVVAGVSLGSQFASALAARRPDLVGGLMLVSPTMDPKVRSTPGALVSWLLESRRELGMLHVALPDYLRTGARRANQTMAMALADRPEDRAPGHEMPTLVVHGELDRLVSAEWAHDLASRLPRGRLVQVPGAAHAMNWSSPDEFSRLVVAFATELAAHRPAEHQEIAA